MSDKKDEKTGPYRIYFITSNQSNLDKYIRYDIPKNRGLTDFRVGDSNSEMREERQYKREIFSVYLNSIEIVPNALKKEDQDPTTKRYNCEINLKYNKCTFPGKLNFKHTKNNFIYDLEFKEHIGWTKIFDPPPQIKFSKLDQLKIYTKYLIHHLKKKQKDQIYKDLITDSQYSVFGKNKKCLLTISNFKHIKGIIFFYYKLKNVR